MNKRMGTYNEACRTYREEPIFRMPHVRLSDEEYARAMESLVIVCTDVVFIDRARRSFYLATRRVPPLKGVWHIGGRMHAGEHELDAARRSVRRETSLDIDNERFEFMAMHRYISPLRKQDPQDKGSDTLAFTYAVELTPDERARAAAGLDPEEYDTEAGLREFDRERMSSPGMHPAIIDLYGQIFGTL